jgi:hypothetical protein
MPDNYPWYAAVQGEALEQGDILRGCTVVEAAPELPFPLTADNIEVDVYTFDVVVMTQSCDLENNKAKQVILCPHWSYKFIAEAVPELASKSALSDIIAGRRPRFICLAASEVEGLPLDLRVVDLGRIFSLPTRSVKQLAASQSPRLRLRSPYRENLSQAFARFFMRVGLPQNIKLP